jgi:hypothetical protein
MRILKGSAKGDMALAWASLPENIPEGIQIPTREEAANVLIRFGLAGNN